MNSALLRVAAVCTFCLVSNTAWAGNQEEKSSLLDFLSEDQVLTLDLGVGDDTYDITALLEALASATAIQPALILGPVTTDIFFEAARSDAMATSVFGNDGADTLSNLSSVNAEATAFTAAGDIGVGSGVTINAASAWNGGSFAVAAATAIDGGNGNNTIDNQQSVNATTTANSVSGSASFTNNGFALTVLSTESTSTSTGVGSGDGIDNISNSGVITSTSTARAATDSTTITGNGISATIDTIWDGGTTATATAYGIQSGAGNDTITSVDDVASADRIRAEAIANTYSSATSFTVNGIAIAEVASTATSVATAINAGDGNDTVTVNGLLEADTQSIAYGQQVAMTGDGMPLSLGSKWSSGTTAVSTATGIDGGTGTDVITNNGIINTDANANTEIIGLTATLSSSSGQLLPRLTGNAITDVSTHGIATARAIAGGDGNDTITNNGSVDADAVSTVAVQEFTLGLKGNTIPGGTVVLGMLIGSGGTDSSSLAEGLVGGSGEDTISNGNDGIANGSGVPTAGTINARAISNLPSFGLSLKVTNGPSVNLKSAVDSEAIGINAGDGDDAVTSIGSILADADSSATAIGFGMTGSGLFGAVSSDINLTSESTGIYAGSGSDTVTNDGTIESNASSTGQTANVIVNLNRKADGEDGTSFGLASASSNVGASATANGIVTQSFSDPVVTELGFRNNQSSAGINTHSIETETSGADQDTVTSNGVMTLDAFARTLSATAAISAGSHSASSSGATASSELVGIRTGGDNDTINNHADINGSSQSFALGVNGAVSIESGSATAINKGTNATANASGIIADGLLSREELSQIDSDETQSWLTRSTRIEATSGDDTITNTAAVDMFARATAIGIDAGYTGGGSSATKADSSAVSRAAAIAAGDGADTINNSALLTASANADAIAVAASINAASGLATSVSGSNSAFAGAVGIDGDGEFTLYEESLDLETNAITEDAGVSTINIFNSSSSIESTVRTTSTGGDDIIINDGEIDVNTVAVNVTVEGALVVTKGVSAAVVDSSAEAVSTGIRGGDGGDDITNLQAIDSDAVANADAVGIAIVATGVGVAANKIFEGGTSAQASSIGIEADGDFLDEQIVSITSSIDDTATSLNASVTNRDNTTAASGADVVNNSGTITSTAVAVAPEVSVGIVTTGVAGAISTATAEAMSAGIQAGGNNDTVTNSGDVTAGSVATAVAINVTVDSGGVGLAANSIFDGGVVANASTVGIDADGGSGITTTTRQTTLSFQETSISSELTFDSTAGDDNLTNSGRVIARATSVSPSVTGSYSGGGVAVGISTAESFAAATALDSGGGDDVIVNSGVLTAVATGNADSLNITYSNAGVALSADAVWNGGATTDATAYGIDSDGGYTSYRESREYRVGEFGGTITNEIDEVFASGDDTITNTGEITAVATAVSPSIGVAVTPTGLAASLTTATSNSDAVAIVSGSGSDTITNSATIEAVSTSNADSVGFTLTPTIGVALSANSVWDGGVTANAISGGIRADGLASRNRMTAIDVLTGDDFITTLDESIAGSGDNNVTNNGDISIVSTAVSPSLNIGVAVSGVGVALSTSTANSEAIGIETGAGIDTVTNTHRIHSVADAVAVTINASGTGGGVALSGDAFWDGGTSADAESIAIETHGGADTIINSGELDTNSVAVSASVAGTVAVYGVAGSIATSDAIATAMGIDSGDGADTITISDGALIDTDAIANADAVAVTLNWFGVAASTPDIWDGGITSEAFADGINAGDGDDTITNGGRIDTRGVTVSASASLPVTVGGVAGAFSTSTTKSDVNGIVGGAGNDTITNNGVLETNARATSVAATGSVGVFGVAMASDALWDGGTSSEAFSDSIAGGDGDDTVTNTNSITTLATSRANSINVSISVIGVTFAGSTSSANARGTSISGDGGNDDITNTGELLSDVTAHATSVGVSIAGLGAAGAIDAEWDGGTGSDAKAYGIAGGEGNDTIDNQNRVEARAESDADSVQVAASVGIAAIATASSTADATANALDGGDGNDTITNTAELVANADADAQAAAISIVVSGITGSDPFLNNVTSSDAKAAGVSGGSGSDSITTTSSSSIDVMATSLARDNNVTSTYFAGVSAANANSQAVSTAIGVDAGEENDVVILEGTIDVVASSESNGRSIAFNTAGANLLSAAVSSEATAIGTDGGLGNDSIVNSAIMNISSDATGLGRTVGVTALGASIGGIDQSTATATATGISLGDGIDTLANSGDLTVNATSIMTARSTGVALIGFSAARAKATATSTSYGLVGGVDADSIVNDATVMTTSTATADARDVSINIVGAAIGDSIMTATSNATGAGMADGDDSLVNVGTIAAVSSATGTMDGGNSFTAVGAGLDSGFATVSGTAIGADAGNGDDVVVNQITAVITANAAANALSSGNFAINVAGYASNDLSMNPDSSSTGLTTGAGADSVTNDGLIDVQSISTSTVSGTGITVAGAGGAVVGSTAIANSTGISTGDDDDEVTNNGDIEVGITDAENDADAWMALLDLSSASFAGAGAASSSSSATATTTSIGIDAGTGNDTILNNGSLNVFANSWSKSSASSVNIFGSAGSTENAGAHTFATGIAGGDGIDSIQNAGTVLVSARTKLTLDGSSYRLGGAGTTSGTLDANTTVFGMVGNGGDDSILNTGSLSVVGHSEMSSDGDSNTTFGGSTTAAQSGAVTLASGIDGGSGDDVISNSGVAASLIVNASVDVAADSASYAFFGDPGTNVVLNGSATGVGLSGGDGSDTVASDGSISVTANSNLRATGGAISTIGGGAESTGAATANSDATGLAGGVGDDLLSTSGSLSVRSEANAASQNTSNSGAAIISNSNAGSESGAISTAAAFHGGPGSDVFDNSGDVFVVSRASANAVAYANGATVSITGSATAIVNSTSDATAFGMDSGDDNNVILNTGGLTVSAESGTTQPITVTQEILSIEQGVLDPDAVDLAETEAPDFSGDTLPPSGDGTDYDEGDVLFWNGEQDVDGNGPVDDPLISSPGSYYQVARIETVESDGSTTVTWEWQQAPVTAYERNYATDGQVTEAGARGHGTNGNGIASATGSTTSSAIGVRLGDGNNTIRNEGQVNVIADANALVSANANGSSTGDATASATAIANATSTGLSLGDGNNTFENTGDLTVTAIAAATATASTDAGDGLCVTILFWEFCIAPGTANPPTSSETRTAHATGVATGDGNNFISNSGNILVVARASDPNSISASGVVTGGGDDVVVNNGLISATIEDLSEAVIGTGIGIDTGDGNDQVQLGGNSLVVGTVNLGDGNDTLILQGNPEVTDHLGNLLVPDAGSGIDMLVLVGAGNFASTPTSIENATKISDGLFSLPGLNTMASLTIDGGILELGSDYTFGAGSSFSTYIHSDGSYGGLQVNGITNLDGSINVERRGDEYINSGTRYSVVDSTAGALNQFAAITLPDALPLLSFDIEHRANSVDVVALAASFASTTDVRLHQQVALILDDIAAGSSGEFREQLGTIQQMDSGFDSAYASLSPDSYLSLTTNTVAIAQQTTRLLQTHLSNARAVGRGAVTQSAAYNSVALAYNGGQMSSVDASLLIAPTNPTSGPTSMTAANARTWLMGFAGNSAVDLIDGYTDYDQDMSGFVIGADYLFPSNIILGASIAFADSTIVMDKAAARTDADNWSASMYATAFSDNNYVEGGLYFGREDFTSTRELTINGDNWDSISAHDGSTTMAFLGAGRFVNFEKWNFEPYATLYYFDIDEDAFAESGAGDLNQQVARKSTEVLLGEFGAKFNWLRPTGNGVIDWHASIAYNHDFEIDDAAVHYAFEGAPTTLFSIDDRNVSGGSTAFGAGLAYIKGRSILSFDYRGQTNGDYQHHVYGARIAYAFR